jgi:signal transduction histidine kinase
VWPGSLAGRLALLLAAFMILATVAVVVREYRVGEQALVGETVHALQVRAGVASQRLTSALAERKRLTSVWAGLETSQDLAVDDVDKRLSGSLSELVHMLGTGTEAVGVRLPGRLLAASDPVWLAGSAPPLPEFVSKMIDAPAAGLALRDARPAGGMVVSTADVVSRADGSLLGRLAVWTPLKRFLAGALPLELGSLEVKDSTGAVLFQGDDVSGSSGDYLWVSETITTVAGPLTVSVARPRAELTSELGARGRQLVTLALVFLLLTLPVTLLVVRSATSGLGRLTRAARELDALDPEPLPPVSRWAPREVRVLADAMDAMIERLERAREEVAKSESLAAVGMLTKSLAHEIRTPLSVLRAGTEMLFRSAQADPRQREVSEMLQMEVERLARLVDDLLVFGRPSAPVLAEMDLRRICQDALSALEPEAAEKSVTLSLAGDAWVLRADADQIRQVVVNLVGNSIRACEAGGAVRVRTSIVGDDVVLEVDDDGVGIPPERLLDIWTPLFTTHPSGTGLGLPIVKQLVEAHGGSIEVESEPGRGTRMRVSLPMNGVDVAGDG